MRSWGTVWGMTDTWQHITLIALFVAAIAQTVFVALYIWLREWWKHYVGRALMAKSFSLWLVLWMTLANTFFIYPYQEQIGTVVFVLLVFAIVYQCVSLIRIIREGSYENW